jgi:hypothetical protein
MEHLFDHIGISCANTINNVNLRIAYDRGATARTVSGLMSYLASLSSPRTRYSSSLPLSSGTKNRVARMSRM